MEKPISLSNAIEFLCFKNHKVVKKKEVIFQRKKIASWTQKHSGEYLAIVMNGKVWSAPLINQGIPGGRLQITEGFTLEEVKNRTDMFNLSHPIPIELESITCLKKS